MRGVLGGEAMIFDPFAIEVDEALGDRVALGRVGTQQLGPGAPLQYRDQLPAQIEGVLHRHVHALAGLGAVGVAGVAGDEHAGQSRAGVLGQDVVKPVGDALADLVTENHTT